MVVNVLVVGVGERAQRWTAWLERAGWNAFVCAGPELAWECPRLHGAPCPRRELAQVAVVAPEVQPDRAEHICTRIPDDGTTISPAAPEIAMTSVDKGVPVSQPAPALLIGAVREVLSRSRDDRPE